MNLIIGDYYGVTAEKVVCFMSFYPDFSFVSIDTASGTHSSGEWHQNSEAEIVTLQKSPSEKRDCYQWVASRRRLIKSCGKGALVLRRL